MVAAGYEIWLNFTTPVEIKTIMLALKKLGYITFDRDPPEPEAPKMHTDFEKELNELREKRAKLRQSDDILDSSDQK